MISGVSAPRRAVVLLLSVVLGAALVSAGTSSADAASRPGKVGIPWVKAQSMTYGRVSMTVDWTWVKGATRYEVFYATTSGGASSSGATRRVTRGSTSELTIPGLRRGTTYCFTVRAVSSGGAGARSSVICKPTMRLPARSNLPAVSVATFNVCSNAGSCKDTWTARLPHLRARIRLADADVVTLQEVSCVGCPDSQSKIKELVAGLPEYAIARYSTAKAVIFRTAKFSLAEGGRDEAYGYVDAGTTTADDDRGAVWADLVSTAGRRYRFFSVHLQSGDTTAAANLRRTEMAIILRRLGELETASGMARHRTVIAGDFNTHRNRSNDWPRVALAAWGFYDTSETATTYTNGRFNSANQFDRRPNTSIGFGSHVDHVFAAEKASATRWKVVHTFNPSGWYTAPLPSDHAPVRVTLGLP